MIDLHTHSACSDGTDSPADLVRLAKQAGLRAIALTDHDTTSGIKEAEAEARAQQIEFIPGIELSAEVGHKTVHLLGYFISPSNERLSTFLKSQRESRRDRNAKMVARLNELGFDITVEEIEVDAGASVPGRPHFARVLTQRGFVASYEEAFSLYVGNSGSAYIERNNVHAGAAIEVIHASGGLAAWAHPILDTSVSEAALQPVLAELMAAGLDGLEAWYSRYAPKDRRLIATVAKRHGLVPTGGSDYHGNNKKDLQIGSGTGDLQVPDTVLHELLGRKKS